MDRKAFTLIELLVVIAIIAILAVVVVLTLNPAELLRQSRDANRVSDIATITNAVNLYTTDQSGVSTFSLGLASDTYPSIYDSAATSTNACPSLGLSALNTSAGQAWQCSSSSTYRNVNGLGWIPINLSKISAGSPIGSLPADPTNQTSSGLFYAYNTNGTQFEATANLESQKYKTQFAQTSQTNLFPDVISGGTPTISALYSPSGLAGYWPITEGSGTIAYDHSGNGYNATWYLNGSPVSSPYDYIAGGKVGPYAGSFNVSTSTYLLTSFNNTSQPAFTVSVWEYSPGCYSGNCYITIERNSWDLEVYSSYVYFFAGGSDVYAPITLNAWQMLTGVYTGSALYIYVNGNYITGASASALSAGSNMNIGFYDAAHYFTGYLNDVRIYNRALSSAEIMSLYTAEK